MGLGGSGIFGGGGGGMSTNPGSSVFDSLRDGGKYPSRRSGSMDRGAGLMMDDHGGGMESRMSGGGNMYSMSGGGGGGGRMSFDRGGATDYNHGRASSIEFDRGDRGGSDPYARPDTSTVFVKNVSHRPVLITLPCLTVSDRHVAILR